MLRYLQINYEDLYWEVEICSPEKYLSDDSKLKIISEEFETSSILNQIRSFSKLDHKRIGWNYPLDYLAVMRVFDNCFKPGMLVFDIGCGPSPLHKYIEHKYSIEIVGIDINRWDEGDCVDFQGSMFLDKAFTNKIIKEVGTPDIIISVSAFEHLNLIQHKECIDSIQELKSIAIITSCVSSKSIRTITNNQINLSIEDLNKIYKISFEDSNYILQIAKEYSVNPALLGAYILRFGYPSKLKKISNYFRGLFKFRTIGDISNQFPDYLTFLATYT